MSRPPQLVAQRYRLLDRLGTGAMGDVWKAQDVRFDQRFVAIKLLREDDTHKEDSASRERLLRLIREETDGGYLTLTLGVNLLDEVLQAGKGLDRLRTRVREKADAQGRLMADTVLGLFDELVGDPSCCESARHRVRLRRLFRDEANSVAGLRHHNIVSISDYGEENGVPYLAMDYIEGQTLLRVIQRGEPMPRERQLRLMEDLCAGLAYAHNHNFVHRDIKPANLIIERGTDSLKILDFGVVKRLQDTPESTMGLPIGTLCYMSPEQISGSAAVDRRSDVFAVGSVFYELLSGHKAFPVGQGMTDLIARIQKESPPPVRDFVPDIEPEIEAILDRALRKSPDDRYQFLFEMGRDLARLRTRIESAAENQDQTLIIERGEKTIAIRPSAEPLFPRLLRRGEQALAQGDFAFALESAEQVLALDPTNAPALHLRSRARALERAHRIEEGCEQARRHLEAGELTAARKTCELLRDIDPDALVISDILAEVERAEAQREAERLREQRLQALLAAAREHLTAGAFEEAAGAARDALALAPSSPAARDLLSQAESQLLERREKEAREAKRQREIASLIGRVDQALRARDYRVAAGLLRDAQRLAPERLDLRQRLEEAEGALEQERRREAVRDAVARAKSLLEADRLDEAADALQPASAIDPTDASVLAVLKEIETAKRAHEAELARQRAEAEATIVVRRAEDLFTRGAHQQALDLLAAEQTLHQSVAERLRLLQQRQAKLDREEQQRKQRETEARLEAERREAERLRVDRSAAVAIEEARREFAIGQREAAWRRLEEFTPAHGGVAAALSALKAEAAAIDRLKQEEEDRRRLEEAQVARAGERAALVVEAERASANNRFEETETLVVRARRLDPTPGEQARLEEAFTTARLAMEERRRLEELERRAARVVEQARRDFAEGRRDAALNRLKVFTPYHSSVATAHGELQEQFEAIARREAEAREQADRAAAEAAARAKRIKAVIEQVNAIASDRDAVALLRHTITVEGNSSELGGLLGLREARLRASERREARRRAVSRVQSWVFTAARSLRYAAQSVVASTGDRSRILAIAATMTLVILAVGWRGGWFSGPGQIDISDGPADAPSSNAPGAPVSNAPSTPVREAPSTPVSVAPSTPVSVAPSTPVSEAPSTPVSVAPSTPVSEAPSTPVSKTPSTPVSKAPGTPVSKAPSTPVSKAPSTPVGKASSTPMSEAPSTPVSKAPSTPVSEAPSTPVSEAPSTPVSKAPDTPSSNTPGGPPSNAPDANSSQVSASSGSEGQPEAEAIRRLLAEYELAYEKMDEARLRQINPAFPGFPSQQKALLNSVRLTLSGVRVDLSPDGTAAVVRATQNFRYDWKRSGFPSTASGSILWNMKRVGTIWRVVP